MKSLPFAYAEKKSKFTDREAWLQACAAGLIPLFGDSELPPFRVSFSYLPKKRLGQCHPSKQSQDNRHELFISAKLDDPLQIAATLAHEMAHAAVGTKAGHKAPFRRVAVSLGLEGKMTATHAGESFIASTSKLLAALGPVPHAALDLARGAEDGKKQGTRMLKVECCECGYTVRTTQKWIDVGMPTCPCGEKMRTEDADEGEDD